MNKPDKIELPASVYAKVAAVTGELAKSGIAKDKSGQGYKFRGIDDVYNALAPLLAKHGLNVFPRILSRELIERKAKSGGALFYTVLEAEFDFVSADDGSCHTVRTFGEAMDSGDKGTNKAMSAAYKYAAFMTFAIPTEGEPDAGGETHEVSAEMPDDVRVKIIQLCEAVGGNQAEVICNAYSVGAITDLSPNQADAVIKRLEEKLKEKVDA